MYLVVSKWQIDDEEQFRERGRGMRDWLRDQPGVVLVEAFRCEDGNAIAVVGYESEDQYRKLILEPDGPFERKAREMKLEDEGHWLWSERGETVDND